MRVTRIDKGAPPLDPAEPAPGGGVVVSGRAMRSGALDYVKDGKLWREVRPPEENVKAIPSLHAAPVTDSHPPEMVSADNAKRYAVGTVLEAHADGEWAIVRMAIHDGTAIQSAKRAGFLSAGYSCEVFPPDPELEKLYGKHDGVQRNIVINHIARVDAARAGTDAQVRLDSAGNEVIVEDSESKPVPVNKMETPKMQLKVDGHIFEVADANIQIAVDKAIASGREQEKARADAAEKQASEQKAKADALEAKIKADADAIKKCDECDGSGKCDMCGGKGEYAKKDEADLLRKSFPARVAKGTDARAKLFAVAQKILGTNEKLDGSDRTIKEKVIAKALPSFKFDGRSDSDVSTAFEIATADADKVKSIDSLRTVVTAPTQVNNADARPTEPDAARERSDAAYRNGTYGK